MGLWLRDDWRAESRNGAAALLLHGFTGDPKEMLPLAEGLAAAGYGVRVPVLPGHGGAPHELMGLGWRDWLDGAAAALAELRRDHDRIFLGGFSMGGALSVLLARDGGQQLAGLLLLATPTTLGDDWRLGLLPLLKHVMPWFKPLEKADFSAPEVRRQVAEFDPGLDLDDPGVHAALRSQVRLPVGALEQLTLLLAAMRPALPLVSAPALIQQGALDDTARPFCAVEIARRLGGPAELRWWERSGHMLLQGPESAAIVAQAVAFCEERAAAPGA
ncbi:MAG TPA: alpha/beta fold hydrolase [Herpetosiphonaceae bacterium]